MPTLWEEAGFVFRFRMGDCDERSHVHVTGNDGTAKVWFGPVALARSRGYADPQIGRILRIAGEHEREWLLEWEKRCGSE
jgi:Domain of unknown function (DUF4160)